MVLLDSATLRAVLGAVSMFAVISAAADTRDAALTTAAFAVLVLVSRTRRHRNTVNGIAARHAEK
ncbi:hypothetical protein CH293_02910 [Rhodococcus sp. 14-2470-1b]|nr:hypothetical protein CH293_02910 [Rhodococcus sp. 14-2470-1b]